MQTVFNLNNTEINLLDPFLVEIYVRHGEISMDTVDMLYTELNSKFKTMHLSGGTKHKLHDEFMEAYSQWIDYRKALGDIK